MMGMRGFTLNSEERDAVLLELDRAHGNKEYALSLKLRSVLAAGEGRGPRKRWRPFSWCL